MCLFDEYGFLFIVGDIMYVFFQYIFFDICLIVLQNFNLNYGEKLIFDEIVKNK